VLSIVLGLYIGFSRLNQLRFIARDPILTGILQVGVSDHLKTYFSGPARRIVRQSGSV
jgi:hypothetical protein